MAHSRIDFQPWSSMTLLIVWLLGYPLVVALAEATYAFVHLEDDSPALTRKRQTLLYLATAVLLLIDHLVHHWIP